MSLFYDVLEYAYKKEKIVTIEILGSSEGDVLGYISSLEGNFITIKIVDSYGSYDGNVVININDVTHLICDSEYEASIDSLVNYN